MGHCRGVPCGKEQRLPAPATLQFFKTVSRRCCGNAEGWLPDQGSNGDLRINSPSIQGKNKNSNQVLSASRLGPFLGTQAHLTPRDIQMFRFNCPRFEHALGRDSNARPSGS